MIILWKITNSEKDKTHVPDREDNMRLSQRFTDYLNNQNDKSKLGGNEQQYTNNHVLLLPSKQVKYILKF